MCVFSLGHPLWRHQGRRPDAPLAVARHALAQGARRHRVSVVFTLLFETLGFLRLDDPAHAGAVARRSIRCRGASRCRSPSSCRSICWWVLKRAADPAARRASSGSAEATAMDTLSLVAQGFGVALQPINLLYCFVGVFIGTLVGVLPGIGPISAMSLLLPVTLVGHAGIRHHHDGRHLLRLRCTAARPPRSSSTFPARRPRS